MESNNGLNSSPTNASVNNEASDISSAKVTQDLESATTSAVGSIVIKPSDEKPLMVPVFIEPGQNVVFDFTPQELKAFFIDQGNLNIRFTNDQQFTLVGFEQSINNPVPAMFALSDGTILSDQALFDHFAETKNSDAAQGADKPQSEIRKDNTGFSNDNKEAANEIESEAKAMAMAASSLAAIEPAAGDESGQGGDTDDAGGFGFGSNFQSQSVQTINAVGPIGPTALQFNTNFAQQDLITIDPVDPVANPTPITPEFFIEKDNRVKEDQSVELFLDISNDAGSGSTMTIELGGFPAGSTFSGTTGGAFNPSTGIFTIVVNNGEDFTGGPIFSPPADSDIDLIDRPVRITITDPATGTVTVEDTLSIIVDAVADVPNLSASPAAGVEGEVIPLNISTSVTDTDGSETIKEIRISNLPPGTTLNAGVEQGGVFILSPADLPGLGVIVPDGVIGNFTLTVESISQEAPVSDQEFDFTDNEASAIITIDLTIIADAVPELSNAEVGLDESNLSPSESVSGTLSVEFGGDVPGTITPVSVGGFNFSGSVASGVLSSQGDTVVVSATNNGFIGQAGGRTIFELTLASDNSGDFVFNLFDALDHADGNDDNDVINLNFDVIAEDSEGDQTQGTITINVADDAPVAVDDVRQSGSSNTITGNVLANDDIGQDTPGVVSSISINGSTSAIPSSGSIVIGGNFGDLTISADGSFTYTVNGNADGTDVFTYVLTDFDGDSDTATLTINVDNDDVPVIIGPPTQIVDESNLPTGVSVGGVLQADFGTDTPGSFVGNDIFIATGSVLGGSLSSNGFDVSVNFSGTSYTGTSSDGRTIFTLNINPNGSFTFNQLDQLDHANGNDDNDVITLNFGFSAQDSDDDSSNGTISIDVRDDAPVAVNDSFGPIGEGGTVTGNLLSNDDIGEDTPGLITQITVGGNSFAVPSNGANISVSGPFGDLTINANGIFSFTATGEGVSSFTYTLQDFDGDTDTATFSISSVGGVFRVGSEGDDDDGSTDPHFIGGEDGVIDGGIGSDVLVGDVGGSVLIPQAQDFDIVLVLDTSGSMGTNDTNASRISILADAVKNLMADFDAFQSGQIKAHIISFATNVKETITIDFADPNALAQANTFLDNLNGSGLTNYESPLQAALNYLNGPDPIGGTAQVKTFFISDGAPNRYVDANGEIANPPGNDQEEDSIVLAEITGSSVTTSDGTFGDNTNEVGELQSFGEVIGVGINIGPSNLNNINAVDSSGAAINIDDPQDLNAVLQELNPVNNLLAGGNDVLNGGDGKDFIFGSVLFTDDLAQVHGFNNVAGSGFAVFERLEAGESSLIPDWTRATTLEFIKNNAEEIGQETVNASGEGREGDDDVITGGSGDDVIFGQEGDDRIFGNSGDDLLFGGSGSDTFVFDASNNGFDTIKDFNASEDVIDLSALLTGFDPLQDSINDFVFATSTNGNTTISVDSNGSGNAGNAVNIALLEGVSSVDLETITNNGQATV